MDELRGNKNYEKIYWTAAPKGFEFLAGTYEGNEFISPCQDPPPPDPFHSERIDQLRILPLNSPGTTVQGDQSKGTGNSSLAPLCAEAAET